MKAIAKLGILGGIGLLFYRWYKQAQGLIVGIESVTVKNIDLTNLAATISLNVEIENPLDFGVTVNGLVGTVYLQGVAVGSINAEYNYYISGKTRHIIPIYIHTTLKAVGEAIWDGIMSGNIKNMDLDVDAKIYATKLNIGIPVQLHWGTGRVNMRSDGKNRFMVAGNNSDIVSCWRKCYEEFKDQPMDIVSEIRTGSTIDDKCQAIFGYMVTNTRYLLDPDGSQLIKSPGRLIADGCGDCKSYTMFIASCLHCLGIPCKVRFVNFDGGTQYTHVYPVAIDEQGNEIVMDACELDEDGTPLYDYARRYMRKKDLYYAR